MTATTVPSVQEVFAPESLQKKQKTQAANAQQAAADKEASKKLRQDKRKVIFDRAEKYQNEYFKAERDIIEAKRAARQSGEAYVEAEPQLVFVVRIKGINKIAPKPRKILQLMRLHQINNGVFVRITKATMEMLKVITPYVTFGYPNLATVRKLVYKRGYGKVNKQRVALSDNAIIEKELGQYGIICIEDLIHEIYTVGPNFKQAANFLWPFKLSNPSGNGSWETDRKFNHFIEGGAFGNREEKMNQLLAKMM